MCHYAIKYIRVIILLYDTLKNDFREVVMKQAVYLIFLAGILILSGCANAGKDQKVEAGSKVVLDGSASTTNLGGKITKFIWEQVSGIKVELSSNNSATTTFIAPNVKEIKKTISTEPILEKSFYSRTIYNIFRS